MGQRVRGGEFVTQTELAASIRRVIRGKGLVQWKVAERAGFSEQQFSDMLVGRKVIRAEYMPDIARAIGVEVADIYSAGQDSA
jgi:predicted phage gp36 major capsid-like protein